MADGEGQLETPGALRLPVSLDTGAASSFIVVATGYGSASSQVRERRPGSEGASPSLLWG